MWIRWWKRLAGFIAIELTAGAGAANFQYKAGTASIGQARALVLEDRRGNRAVLAQINARITLATADFLAVHAMERFGFAREGLLIQAADSGEAQPDDLLNAIAAALNGMYPAELRYGTGRLSVMRSGGSCLGSLASGERLRLDGCGGGELVRSPSRAAFRVVEPDSGLHRRAQIPPVYPLQVIVFGGRVVVVGLPGEPATDRFQVPGVILVPYGNESAPFMDTPQLRAALGGLLRRAGAPARIANYFETR